MLDDVAILAIEHDLAAAHVSLARGKAAIPASRPTTTASNGVYSGLVRARAPRDPATASLLAKVGSDLGACLAVGARAIVESACVVPEEATDRAPEVIEVIEAVFEADDDDGGPH